MKKTKIIICIAFVMLSFFSYSQHIILKSFVIDDEEQKLDNNFKIFFVYEDENEKIIYTPTIKKDTFHYPRGISTPRDTNYYHWLLSYKGKIYHLRSGWLFLYQEVEIVIDTKLHKEYRNRKWASEFPSYFKDSLYNNYGVIYIKWHSHNAHDAITCNPIRTNMKTYFRKGKELLKSSDIKKKKKGK